MGTLAGAIMERAQTADRQELVAALGVALDQIASLSRSEDDQARALMAVSVELS